MTDEWRSLLTPPWPARPWDEVHPRLSIGGSWQGPPAAGLFDRVLSVCAPFEGGRFHGTPHYRHALRDEAILPELDVLEQLVGAVVAWVRAGDRVLVRCFAGLNRSGLVVGLALRELTELDGPQCIALIRSTRDTRVLCNPTFAAHVSG